MRTTEQFDPRFLSETNRQQLEEASEVIELAREVAELPKEQRKTVYIFMQGVLACAEATRKEEICQE